MAKVVPIATPSPSTPNAATDPRSEAIAAAIRKLISVLAPTEQERLLTEISETLRLIPAPRAGDVLGAIVRLLPKRRDWTIEDVKRDIDACGVRASAKEIYNALGYLKRKGHIRRVAYGQYVVDGVMVVTPDELGGPPSRHEIDDT